MSGNDVFRFDSPKMDLSGAHILSKLIPNSVKSIGGGCAGLCTPGTPPFSRFWLNIKQSNSSFLCRSCESIRLPALLYHDGEEMADPIMNIYKCNRKSIDQWHASAGRHETSDPDQLQSHRHNSHNIQQTWYRSISGNKRIFLQQLVADFGNLQCIISCKGQGFNYRAVKDANSSSFV
uniref:Uncharacterized protein n=1 Tax=Glossina pallidipes TaxID=7398 RepID=A0A1B0AAU1_GLOPL